MDLEHANIDGLSDMEIADHMRKCNYEKFKTLVRMHLSFELDLNTDEFDMPWHEIVYEDRGKLRKWNRLSKKHKYTHSGVMGNSTSYSPAAECLSQQIDPCFLMHLKELKDFICLEKNLKQEGIFRKTGSVSRQTELRLQIRNPEPLDLEDNVYSAHDCATVFKGYLAELPEPLLTDAHYPAHLQIATLCQGAPSFSTIAMSGTPNGMMRARTSLRVSNPERRKRDEHLLNSVQLLLLLLSIENRRLLQDIIEMLHKVTQYESSNKMSPQNLATLFAPHLICPRNLPPQALHYVAKRMSSIVAYMITIGVRIFEVPAKLSTDIRAYFMERKRKNTMSPEQTLDDSISDMSTVNTVYTFVDREKTAAAHTANTTDTELAQLYAHIQSLPESSKKRRLIKQFNKQNGQGTPLQLVTMNRLKNSEASRSCKSISDSIKKHIFNKGIMSRTPKRTNAIPATFMDVETPNFSTAKNPMLRVLFKSPADNHNAASSSHLIASASSSSSSTSPFNTITNSNSFPFKKHPLQKSLSHSSILSVTASLESPSSTLNFQRHKARLEDIEPASSCSCEGCPQHSSITAIKSCCSASSSVDLQTSTDYNQSNISVSTTPSATCAKVVANSSTRIEEMNTSNTKCCVREKFHSQTEGGFCCDDEKTVVWQKPQLLMFEKKLFNARKQTQSHSSAFTDANCAVDSSPLTKTRYKSEPNLSYIFKNKLGDTEAVRNKNMSAPKFDGTILTRKLIKGVSMVNLKFPFSTAESTQHLVYTVSSTLKRLRSVDAPSINNIPLANDDCIAPFLGGIDHSNGEKDMDDETFEDNPEDHMDSNRWNSGHSAEHIKLDDNIKDNGIEARQQQLLQQNGLCRSLQLVTSTPSLQVGRRSMSPITKSTQRMSKAMQESIMTPRSRKPVMILSTPLGSADQNQTTYQTDLSSFHEQEEEDSLNDSSCESNNVEQQRKDNDEALTNNFKQYLLSRSLLMSSPVDSSFSSQPNDFSSKQDIENLDNSQLSPSLLYCLDGNQPEDVSNDHQHNVSSQGSREGATDFFGLERNSKSGKRASVTNVGKLMSVNKQSDNALTNKENHDNVSTYLLSNKRLISEYVGETSF